MAWNRLLILIAFALGCIAVFAGMDRNPSSGKATLSGTSETANIQLGMQVYQQRCWVCHGLNGDGEGPAAGTLDPKPRNFKVGKYRLVSAANGVPFKDDLVRTIRNGMAGTSMPAWRQLSDAEIDAVADYVFDLTRQQIVADLTARKLKPAVIKSLADVKSNASNRVEVPPEPPVTDARLGHGRDLFLQTCAKCHGDDGMGRQDPAWRTDEGMPIASRNFNSNIFKGGYRASDLYTRVSAGMPGTPMASFSSLPPDDIWCIVQYVRLLAGKKSLAPEAPPVAAANDHLPNAQGE